MVMCGSIKIKKENAHQAEIIGVEFTNFNGQDVLFTISND